MHLQLPPGVTSVRDVYKRQVLNSLSQCIDTNRIDVLADGAVSERCSGVSYYKFLCGVQERGNWATLGLSLIHI